MPADFSSIFGVPDPKTYGDHRHPDLPYGYWLTSTGDVPGEPPLVDEEGSHWGSVRDEFWSSRLGMPTTHTSGGIELLEFMLSFLAIIDGRFVEPAEKAKDIFLDNRHFAEFFEGFMVGVGLLNRTATQLTLEGRAVLLMLIATRSHDDANEKIGLDWIAATRTVAPVKERLAAADLVERRERVASRMAHRFKPDVIGDVPVVKLIGLRITEAVPVRSTLWTMSWPEGDVFARNQFYLWLLERIDRWDDWSAMVTDHGTRALTEHFMKLAFCDRFAVANRND